jgi:hypothetical protein
MDKPYYDRMQGSKQSNREKTRQINYKINNPYILLLSALVINPKPNSFTNPDLILSCTV